MARKTDYGCDPRGNHNRTYLKTHTCRIESMHGKHTLGPNPEPKDRPRDTRSHGFCQRCRSSERKDGADSKRRSNTMRSHDS